MTPEQLAKEKELADQIRDQMRAGIKNGPPEEPSKDTSKEIQAFKEMQFYGEVGGRLSAMFGHIHMLRRDVEALAKEAGKDPMSQGGYNITEGYTANYFREMIDTLKKTATQMHKQKEEEFFKEIGMADPREKGDYDAYEGIINYEERCIREGSTPTAKDRQKEIEMTQWFNESQRHTMSYFSTSFYGPGHPMWDGGAKKEESETRNLDKKSERDSFWDRQFGQQPPAEPDRGEDMGR